MLLARPALLFAEDQKALPPAKDTVIVPYDPKKPLKDQQPDKVHLAYDRFLELWEAAKKSRAAEKPPFAAAAFALGAARYEGRVEEKRVAFTATVEVSTFDDPWVRVPLPFAGVQLSEFALDGKPAAFADGVLVVEKPGKHVLTAKFEIPLAPGAREFAWGIPQTAATRLSLTLPETRWTARIQPDAGVIERTVDGKKTVTAALGTTANVQVSLVEAEGVARLVEPAVAEIETVLTSFAAFERVDTTAAFVFPGARQDRFTVSFDKDLALVSLDAPGMKSWKLAEVAGPQTLEVILAEPAKESYRFTIGCERQQADAFPAERTAPLFSGGARRTERTIVLYAGLGMELNAAPAAGLRQVDFGRPPKDGAQLTGAWAGEGALAYRATLAQAKHEARVDYVYQVNRRKIELIASMQLHAKGAPLFDTALTLPAGFDVQAVDSERLQDWWRDGQKLLVRFKGATPEMTPLVVYLVREYAAAPQQLDVQPLALDAAFAKVTGEAVVAAHKGVDATLTLTENGDAEPAKEVDPANAAPDFQILPPLERKRGFAFKNQSFAGKVALAALPVKQNAVWVMHAEAHEAWASLSLKVQLVLRQGSIERTSFSLPASLPEAHVSGDEVRETRSRVEGERRIYEVAFQNDVYESVDVQVDVDVAMTEGQRPDGRKVNELTLPAPAFPEAQIVTGYVLADNASEYELKLETDGVEQVPTAEIPWLPALTKGAGVFRVQPGWKVGLVLERLEKAETRPAFCAWAEMTTSLRNDGTEWHKAVWHLQNRSLQFLPVKLPDGAVLVSARVAGQSVRADSGLVNGAPAILIPLIKTKPGDLSYDVEVVWRHAGQRLPSRGELKFKDAELLGITVEQTFWTVWLPHDRKLTKAEGNMEEVIEVLREVEKARSAVEELRLLNGILSDQNVSEETRFNAKRNWEAVYADVQKQVQSNGGVLQSGRYSGQLQTGERKKAEQELLDKAQDSNETVAQELSKVAAENKRVQALPQARVDVSGSAINPQGQGAMGQNAAQVLLFGNNAPTADQQLRTGGGVQVDGRGEGQQAAQVQRAANLRWAMNPMNKVPQQEAAPAQTVNAGETQNFYLNDNIVLQQAKGKKQIEEMDRTETATKAPQGKFRSLDELNFSDKDGGKVRMDPAAQNPLEKLMDAEQGQTALVSNATNLARGNRLQQMEQAQLDQSRRAPNEQQPAPSQPQPDAKSAPAAPAAPVAQPPMSQTTPGTPQPGPAGGAVALPGFGDPAGRSAPAGKEQNLGYLQPLGRLSLAVDFPTEGRVYHFQKVKADAVLELKFADPKIVERWIRTGIFAGIAVVLWLLGRVVRTRRA